MTTTSYFALQPRIGAMFAIAAMGLAGCSTVKDIVPLGSSVPYAHEIKPTIAQPAVTEIPAFKPTPKPPAPATPPPAPPAAAPAASAAPPPAAPSPAPAAAPQPPAPPPAPAVSQDPTPPPPPASDAAPPAPPPRPQSSLAAPAATRTAGTETPPPATEQPKPTSAQDNSDAPPSISEERLAFNDDGRYPNLAQVPARPVNMPTFAEAAKLEKTLQSDSAGAKSPASATATAAKQPAGSAPGVPVAVNRLEDRAPCLGQNVVSGDPTVTLHFKPGSAALTAEQVAVLVDALPAVRVGKGTIRIFGHGDTDVGSPQSAARFDLAVARAGAVAQALAGYGIPTPRLAVGVACADTAVAGASVQLFAES